MRLPVLKEQLPAPWSSVSPGSVEAKPRIHISFTLGQVHIPQGAQSIVMILGSCAA